MKIAAASIAIALMWSACSLAEPVRPVQIEIGTSFSLKVGASAHARDAALQIGFEAVTADSRCPKGEQCVLAGDATVQIWVQQGSGPRQTRELHVAPGAGQALTLQDHQLRLLHLDPYPIASRRVAAADYVATFAVSRGAGTDPVR